MTHSDQGDYYEGPAVVQGGILRPASGMERAPDRAPVPTWYLLLVRELMEAGNQVAELLESPTTEAEAAGAAARWEAAMMATARASDELLSREPSAGDVVVKVRLRATALYAMTEGQGLPVNGTMQLVQDRDGAYAIAVWSAEMPKWPDPVPGNAAAHAEREAREQ